ncbi:sensor domain-containing protein [Saliterribacillus persicus]|uniref:PAS domain S-box-containing protein/diguanylate cyclase (GGDEF)-like protein n=1 Tax=Saliterribacillus persicus TaxID=930114 RepID=A0A368X6Y1_9BACI|nr:bifunctional diguanylate cyclase/phosphodiesterase [Saliterribacillus persicus]RCW62738.1 PAS domain S-box-containing protein/diguanylate cyclase (GGDEF)-like protein [Saliterribacillus persicus]
MNGIFTSQEYYQILQHITDALYVIALKPSGEIGQFVEVNEAACLQSGYSREELLQLKPNDMLASDRNNIDDLLNKHVMTGKTITMELLQKHKYDDPFPVEVNTQLITLNNNQQYIVSIVRDIRARKETENKLHESTKKLHSLFAFNPDIIFTINPDGYFSDVNPAAEKVLKYPKKDIAHIEYLSIIAEPYVEMTQKYFENILRGKIVHFEVVVISKDDEHIELDITAVPIIIDDKIIGAIGVGRDITLQNATRRKLLESEQQYRSLFENNIDPVITFAMDGTFIYLNQATEELTGFNKDELIGETFLPHIIPEELEKTQKEFAEALKGKPHQYETCMYNKMGEKVYLHITLIPIMVDNNMTGIHCIGKDITEKRQIEARLNYMAFHDYLTGLPNQHLFQKDFKKAMKDAKKFDSELALFFLDLDRFKAINDSLGHETGDLLLKKIAQRLEALLDNNAEVYRYGGDEFIILLNNANEKEAEVLAKKILVDFSISYDLNGVDVVVTPSVGISMYPHNGVDKKNLIRKADNAMYHAKLLGKNNFQFYQGNMRNKVNENFEMESMLRKALEQDELLLVYQPQVNASGNNVVGVEALIRWKNEKLGMVSPGEFIPMAEETGLIIPIGEWVIRTACLQNKAWQNQGFEPITMSVNLSIRQFYQSNLAAKVEEILLETGLNPVYLELEITESMAMQADTATKVLNDLKKLGVKIAMDDFGTGYSSLNYLRNFPIDHLKIDQSFIRDISQNEEDQNIITSIIALGHNLNIKLVAEGVETKEQRDFLVENGCDVLQGYYFSRPVEHSEIPAFIRSFLHIN